MGYINIYSEIGKLNKVMLHRPGREVENLIPEHLGKLLFDDIPYLKIAQEEHDIFASILKENGTEVLYLEDLTTEALEDEKVKDKFIREFIEESRIISPNLIEAIYNHLSGMETRQMVDKVMTGLRKDEIHIREKTSLMDLISDDYPFYLDPMPNLYFPRDPGAIIGKGLSLNVMEIEARRRETIFLEYIHKYHKDFIKENVPLWYNRTERFPLEGGDELVLSDKLIAVGMSERTSAKAIEHLAETLLNSDTSFEKILAFDIPKCRAFMHLDTVFTMVDYDKFTIHPGIECPLNIYELTKGSNGCINIKHNTNSLSKILAESLSIDSVELIRCGGGDIIVSGREQWNDGSNTLTIAPGFVVTYERNYVTNELLDKAGVKVLSIPSSELSRGRGGPRCMSMPFNREDISF
ncbi:arginine deiminase [Clostridium cylindrosporum]|uniref:Arginine deiminase n=1 Tax=Clostridium cylindrosporum DSM 605 TaxID=1121307 RepID=A0A0J8DA04_CLOCY|nr:arginine deiminase [Clostridium cylindrosporum]KMT21128.1 arginine deiminase ArcA [Clostridium cylindrosporum DSM 605]